MTKEDAMVVLQETHRLWKPEFAVEVAGAFGIDPKDVPIRIHQDTRSEIKGLTMEGKKEGDEDYGVESLVLAQAIAKHLGVADSVPDFFGRGSQQRAYVAAIEKAIS